ncbi:MAG TPA: trigger factor [Kofleriaceae bacterium]|jgi:trigger factor|nr:trigger factor [Kofleriaceae bacterium]
MQVRIEDVSPVEKKLIVEIPWQTVADRLGVAYRELGKGVALKGFRKGKAPRSVLEQIYAPRVHAEVAYQLVRESFVTANQQHNLGAVAEPRDLEGGQIKKGEPFSYQAIVEIKGTVTASDYEGMPLERRKLNVPDADVDKTIEQLRKEHTELEAIEGRTETAPGDVVILNVVGTIGEHQVNQPKFGVDLDDAEREPVPGLRAALTGIPLDTKDKQIELDIPDDHPDETLKGRHASLTVTVIEARKKLVPALDDEFAKETGKADTLDGLRAAVRKELEDREQSVIANEARQAALRELVKRNQIPVAQSLVDRAVEMQYNRLRQMLGMPPDREGSQLSPDLREKMRPQGADEVRGQLLLEAIAEKEGVTVSEDEVMGHVSQAARARNLPPARLRAEWERDGRLDSARWSLRQDKVLDLLVGKATITEVEKLTEPVEPGLGGGGPVPTEPAHGEEGHVHGPDCNH